ncbi:hypothetical protein E2C01_086926 [Portunus trituberculatus]|uniref:Uncharacterized protein n=1 Tax=Portunus trituberculatus TaxID=210409 RepID=A0A5B7JB21_PORTR|nr:hypothetical protein [Portunus trituberculatus]
MHTALSTAAKHQERQLIARPSRDDTRGTPYAHTACAQQQQQTQSPAQHSHHHSCGMDFNLHPESLHVSLHSLPHSPSG